MATIHHEAFDGQHATDAQRWAEGCGAITHAPETLTRVFAMADTLAKRGLGSDGAGLFNVLRAADRLANAAMWLVVHETYARNVYLDGRRLDAEDFKPQPEGHTGGALNMVPAYPLVAGGRFRVGGADHDQERAAHRPAHHDVTERGSGLVHPPPLPQRFRPDRVRRARPRCVRVGHPRD